MYDQKLFTENSEDRLFLVKSTKCHLLKQRPGNPAVALLLERCWPALKVRIATGCKRGRLGSGRMETPGVLRWLQKSCVRGDTKVRWRSAEDHQHSHGLPPQETALRPKELLLCRSYGSSVTSSTYTPSTGRGTAPEGAQSWQGHSLCVFSCQLSREAPDKSKATQSIHQSAGPDP